MTEEQKCSVKEKLKQQANLVELWLEENTRNIDIPIGLRESMRYSLLAGGKRLRPVLFLTCAKLFGLEQNNIMPFAAAFEFIHTYSLIHDDLPAMDNDDLRRGKASNHKHFGEATAILAGDALLTDAFTLMLSVEGINPDLLVKATKKVALAAGSQGMVAGQFLDILYTNTPTITPEELSSMHAMKTGALLASPCIAAAIIGNASQKDITALENFGKNLGAAFQIVDDILDETGTQAELGKPVGSDAALGKHTYPSLLGLQKSKELANAKAQAACTCLQGFHGEQADFLKELALYVAHRAC